METIYWPFHCLTDGIPVGDPGNVGRYSHPQEHACARVRSDISALAGKIGNAPVLLSLLNSFRSQRRQLGAAQTASQENGISAVENMLRPITGPMDIL